MTVQEQEIKEAPAHLITRSPIPMSRRWVAKVVLGIVVMAYLALATLYSIVIPLGEGPDEPGHADYAFFLARENRLPVQRYDPNQSDVPGEGHQPPLAYLLASAAARLIPQEARTTDVVGNPRFVWTGGTEVNALIHGSRAYWPWRDSTLAWHGARLVSVGLGAVTVVFTYLVAGEMVRRWTLDGERWIQEAQLSSIVYRPSSSVPLLAAALVAFNPQFLFTMALVTNDALLVALSAALLWLVVTTDDGQQKRSGANEYKWIIRSLAIGIVLGLTLITKQSAMLLVPVAAIGVWRQWTLVQRNSTLMKILVTVTPWLLTMSVAGWWYARNRRLYGDLLGLTAFRAEFTTQPFVFGSVAAWVSALAQLHESFWARFGWMNLAPPAWVIAVFVAVEVLALLGYGVLAARQWRTWHFNAQSFAMSNMVVLVLLVLLALAWVISFARTAGLVAWQGRLLFPALPAIAVLLARGLMALGTWQPAVARRIRMITYCLLLTAYCLLAIWLPFGVIRPAYSNETVSEQTAQATPGTPVYAHFTDGREKGVELHGWHVEGDTSPGGTLHITLTWHALGRASRDWWVFIQLTDAQKQVVANTDAPAKSVTFPMTEWTTGDWVQGQYMLQLPPQLAAGTYTLQVGLFDQQGDGRRDGIYDQEGKLLGDSFNLGTITISQK